VYLLGEACKQTLVDGNTYFVSVGFIFRSYYYRYSYIYVKDLLRTYIDENTDILTIEELNKVLEHAKNRKIPLLVNLTMQL